MRTVTRKQAEVRGTGMDHRSSAIRAGTMLTLSVSCFPQSYPCSANPILAVGLLLKCWV